MQLFQKFEKFRIIVLGGDGSIGWVLSTIDKYNLHSKVSRRKRRVGSQLLGVFVCLFVCVFVCVFVCLSVCLSVCLFVCLSVCLSV